VHKNKTILITGYIGFWICFESSTATTSETHDQVWNKFYFFHYNPYFWNVNLKICVDVVFQLLLWSNVFGGVMLQMKTHVLMQPGKFTWYPRGHPHREYLFNHVFNEIRDEKACFKLQLKCKFFSLNQDFSSVISLFHISNGFRGKGKMR